MEQKQQLSMLSEKRKTNNKSYVFNQTEKELLKKKLIHKFTTIYCASDPAFVKNKVNEFLNQNTEINAQNLQALENSFGFNGVQKKAFKKKLPQISLPQIETTVSQTPQEKISKTAETSKIKVDENGRLIFRNDDDEYAINSRYNYILYLKDEKENMKKAAEQKRNLKIQLDQQIREKEVHKKIETLQENSYNNARMKIAEIESKKEESNKKIAKEQIKMQRDMQLKQIKEADERKKQEESKEKAFDKMFVQKVKDELDQEKSYVFNKKKNEYQKLQKVMVENEKRKKIVYSLKEKDRLDEINMQKAYSKLVDIQEEKRAAEFRAKDEILQQFIEKSQKGALKEKQDKDKLLEMRLKQFEEAKEKKLLERERNEVIKMKQEKLNYKQFLDSQVNDNKLKNLAERKQAHEQAYNWKKKSSLHDEFENKKEQNRQRAYLEYAGELKKQIDEKIQKDIKLNFADYDEYFNKKVLEEIKDPAILKQLEKQKNYQEELVY